MREAFAHPGKLNEPLLVWSLPPLSGWNDRLSVSCVLTGVCALTHRDRAWFDLCVGVALTGWENADLVCSCLIHVAPSPALFSFRLTRHPIVFVFPYLDTHIAQLIRVISRCSDHYELHV